jgi:hypothetical protein
MHLFICVQLGWNYKTLIETTPLISFDDVRIKQRRQHYQYSPGLSPLQRRVRLSEFGFSKEEIDNASTRAAVLRRSNEKSVRRIKFDRVAELREDLGRSWRRLKVKMGVCIEPEPDKAELLTQSSTIVKGAVEKKKSTSSSGSDDSASSQC